MDALLGVTFLTFLYINLHIFFRSVSDHCKCGIRLKLSAVVIHSCLVLVVSVVAMATRAKR